MVNEDAMETNTVVPQTTEFPDDTACSTQATTNSKPSKPILRGLPPSAVYFWKTLPSEQLSQEIYDKTSASNKRPVPKNEIAAMALNEAAARHGRGYFLHLLGRKCWSERGKEELRPSSRIPPQPGAQFPNLIYIEYEWTEQSRSNFLESSQRSRYLMCDGLVNPPPDKTPVYAMQYVADVLYPVYATSPETLIILASPSGFYLAKSLAFEEIVGRWLDTKKAPQGPDPHLRLNTTPYIWDGASIEISDQLRELHDKLKPFKFVSMDNLYGEVVQLCGSEHFAPSYTSRDLRQMIPRASLPDDGIALGTPLGSYYEASAREPVQSTAASRNNDLTTGNESSNPRSRKERYLQRGGADQGRGSGRKRSRMVTSGEGSES